MTSTPTRAARARSQYDNQIAEVYAKLSVLELRTDQLRADVRRCCDRVEARLTTNLAELARPEGDPTSVTSLLSGIAFHLSGSDADFDLIAEHLAGIDAHLEQLDAGFTAILRHTDGP